MKTTTTGEKIIRKRNDLIRVIFISCGLKHAENWIVRAFDSTRCSRLVDVNFVKRIRTAIAFDFERHFHIAISLCQQVFPCHMIVAILNICALLSYYFYSIKWKLNPIFSLCLSFTLYDIVAYASLSMLSSLRKSITQIIIRTITTFTITIMMMMMKNVVKIVFVRKSKSM